MTTETTDHESFAPLVFLAYDHAPSTYGLLLSDGMDATAAVFDEHGYEGGGYDWEAIARSAVRSRAPELADRVAYDSEASMFVAYGKDSEALRRLGVLLHEAHRDPAILTAHIAAADPDWFD